MTSEPVEALSRNDHRDDLGSMAALPLQILLIEDSEADARLIEHTLLRSGVPGVFRRVDRQDAIEAALRTPIDVLLCDYSIPGVDALETIELVRRERPDVPVIVVSGSIGEELAVGAMRAGAEDYLLKDRLERLGLAVRQALERRQLRREHRRVEEMARLLLRSVEATRQGVALLDARHPARPIIFANIAFAAITGRSAKESSGCTLTETLGGDAVLTERIVAGLQADRNVELELLAMRKDGSRFSCHLDFEPIRDDAGRTTHIAVNCTDVTEPRRLEERIRRTQRLEALGQLAGGVSHDFNNLLFVINAYAQQLVREDHLSPSAREAAEAIRECGERGTAITRQLLLFSRNEFMAPVRVEVNAAVRDLDRLLRRLLSENIALVTSLDPAVGSVRWGTGMLERVVTNLVLNARDAMPGGGSITVETRSVALVHAIVTPRTTISPGRYITISVIDTGSGMTKEISERLFEPFFTTKGPDRGTGLDLATVYGMVSQAEGSIDVETTLGSGTRFTVYLPDVEQAAATEVHARDVLRRGSERVLLVEDDARVREVVAGMLSSLGYEVTQAEDGRAALTLAYNGARWQAMVSDVVMPGLSGHELAERMRRIDSSMAVLLMSGYSDDAASRSDAERSAISHLQKPFSMTALADAVRAVLASPVVGC